MTFDTALQFLLVAYAVVGGMAVVLGSVFTVRLIVKLIRREK